MLYDAHCLVKCSLESGGKKTFTQVWDDIVTYRLERGLQESPGNVAEHHRVTGQIIKRYFGIWIGQVQKQYLNAWRRSDLKPNVIFISK